MKRIVTFYHAQSIAGLLDSIAEGIERVGLENVSGSQLRDRLRGTINVFHVIDRGVILHCSSRM